MRRVAALVLVVVLGPGCAVMKSPKVDPATKVDVALYEALAAIQDVEMAARYTPIGVAPLIGAQDHKVVSRYLADAFAGLAAYNDALDLGNAHTANQKLQVVKQILVDLGPFIKRAVPDPVAQQRITDVINLALAVIAPLLGVR
jgi:hypothetical protein